MTATAKMYEIKCKPNKSFHFESVKITSSRDAANFARQFYHDDIYLYESFFIIGLTSANKVKGWAKISQGGAAGTYVDIKIIAKYAVDMMAQAIIMIHNHPSGTLKPSEPDIQITNKAKAGLSLLDVSVLDHIILSPENEHYSFADQNKM